MTVSAVYDSFSRFSRFSRFNTSFPPPAPILGFPL